MPRRNVLLIVVDQRRADCVPHLGAKHLRAPNLDRLCREGVTSPITSPPRCLAARPAPRFTRGCTR
ncbi:MAG: hypothetical protein ACJ8AI_34385 [Rhodopila sp.]